jgi:hypothetical protein
VDCHRCFDLEPNMKQAITISVIFVLSIAAMRYAWRMSPIAESGQVGSIIMVGGLIGFLSSFGAFFFICGMLFAGARP